MTSFVAFNLRSYDTWRMRLILTLLIFVTAVILPGRAAAFVLEESQHAEYPGGQYQDAGRVDDVFETVQSNGMSLSQAIEQVRRQTGGKVVSAETRVQGGREVHYIKVLTKDGKVKTHKVNGRKR